MSARILYPVDMTGEGWLFEEFSGGSWSTVDTDTFSPADFIFAHHPTSNAVFTTLEDAINAGSTQNVYSVEPIADDPFGRDDFRVRITRVAGPNEFRISRAGAGDQFMLYMGADADTDVLESTSGVLEFPNSFIGQWLAGPWGTVHWHDERLYHKGVNSMARTNDDNIYITTRTTRGCREYMFLAVPGVCAAKGRVKYKELCDQFGVQWLKENYASFEAFWEQAILTATDWFYYPDVDPETFNAYGYRRITSRVVDQQFIDQPNMVDRVTDFGTDFYDIALEAIDIAELAPETNYTDIARDLYSLVSYYGFGQGDDGGTTVDDSENANNGTYSASYTASGGLVEDQDASDNEAGSVDLSTFHGTLGASTDWDFIHTTGEFTIHFWFDPASATSGTILSNVDVGTGKGIDMTLLGSELVVKYEGASTSTLAVRVKRQRQHVAIVGTGGYIFSMIDGVVTEVANIFNTATLSSYPLSFGREAASATGHPNALCLLDELAIDNTRWRVEDLRRVYYAGA